MTPKSAENMNTSYPKAPPHLYPINAYKRLEKGPAAAIAISFIYVFGGVKPRFIPKDVSGTDLHFCPAIYAATRCESSWTVTEERTAARSFFPNAKNKRKSPAGANGFI